MAEKGLTPADIKKIQKQLKDLRSFISEVEKLGGELPKPLTKALGLLQKAIDTGVDIGEAAEEASTALRAYEKDLMNACKTVDDEMRMVCEAKVSRKYLARGVKFTLDYKKPESVTAKSIKKLVKRHLHPSICKHWDYCAKNDR